MTCSTFATVDPRCSQPGFASVLDAASDDGCHTREPVRPTTKAQTDARTDRRLRTASRQVFARRRREGPLRGHLRGRFGALPAADAANDASGEEPSRHRVPASRSLADAGKRGGVVCYRICAGNAAATAEDRRADRIACTRAISRSSPAAGAAGDLALEQIAFCDLPDDDAVVTGTEKQDLIVRVSVTNQRRCAGGKHAGAFARHCPRQPA